MNEPEKKNTVTDSRKSATFSVTDHSRTAPFLQHLISDQIIKVLPAWFSPNALTLTGGAFALGSATLIWVFADEMRSGSLYGQAMMMLSAIMLVSYGVFDQLDGMQARKLKRSSNFGDFIDHWVDALIANQYTVPVMVLLGVGHFQLWLMAIVTAIAFWAHNWETRNINRRELPVVGGLESIWTAFVIMSLTSIFGVEVWNKEFAGLSLLTVVYYLGLSALLWVFLQSVWKGRENLKDYLGFIFSLTPISIWLLYFAGEYSPDSQYVWLGFISLGLMALLLTGQLIRHQWMTITYSAYDFTSFFLGAALCILAFKNENLSDISTYEILALFCIIVILVLRVIKQGLSSYAEMVLNETHPRQ